MVAVSGGAGQGGEGMGVIPGAQLVFVPRTQRSALAVRC